MKNTHETPNYTYASLVDEGILTPNQVRIFLEHLDFKLQQELPDSFVMPLLLRSAQYAKRQVENKQLEIKRLKSEKDVDTLTGLRKRESMTAAIDEKLDALRRNPEDQNAQFAVAFIDLDKFKQVNDTHGHAAGDTYLQRFADMLRESLRQDDEVFRMDEGHAFRVAGDEFGFVLPLHGEHTWEPASNKRDEQLTNEQRADALQERLHGVFGDYREKEGIDDLICSIGIAVATPEMTSGELLQAADTRMYADKFNRYPDR